MSDEEGEAMQAEGMIPALTLPQRQGVADDVYEALRSALVSNSIAPSSKLNLDELARTMGVSNTPIRQALSRLEAEGLVLREPNRGFIASPVLDWPTVRDMYESRMRLETFTAERAALMATEEDLGFLSGCLRAAEEPTESADDSIRQNVASDEAFHGRIASVAGNRVILEQLQRVNVRARSYRSTYSWPRATELTHQEHQAILDALAARDAAGAHDRMLAHLEAASQRMRRAFE